MKQLKALKPELEALKTEARFSSRPLLLSLKVQKSAKRAATVNRPLQNIDLKVPRDGIEPPTPAFSGQNGGFFLFFRIQHDVIDRICFEEFKRCTNTVPYKPKQDRFGSACMEK
jgi:hypothetical protein